VRGSLPFLVAVSAGRRSVRGVAGLYFPVRRYFLMYLPEGLL
jgi:hypothetical protein